MYRYLACQFLAYSDDYIKSRSRGGGSYVARKNISPNASIKFLSLGPNLYFSHILPIMSNVDVVERVLKYEYK